MTVPWGSCPCNRGTISRFGEGQTTLLRCESLETPTVSCGRSDRSVPPRGRLRRSHPQGREPGRPTSAGADQVRAGEGRSRSKQLSYPTAIRSCGLTIVCRGQARLTFPKIFPFPTPRSSCAKDIIRIWTAIRPSSRPTTRRLPDAPALNIR